MKNLTKKDIEKLCKLNFLTMGEIVDIENNNIFHDKVVFFIDNGDYDELIYWSWGVHSTEQQAIDEYWQDIAENIEMQNLSITVNEILKYNKNILEMEFEERDELLENIQRAKNG